MKKIFFVMLAMVMISLVSSSASAEDCMSGVEFKLIRVGITFMEAEISPETVGKKQYPYYLKGEEYCFSDETVKEIEELMINSGTLTRSQIDVLNELEEKLEAAAKKGKKINAPNVVVPIQAKAYVPKKSETYPKAITVKNRRGQIKTAWICFQGGPENKFRSDCFAPLRNRR